MNPSAPAPHLPSLVWVAIAALVAWRLFSRIRRLVGRQRLKAWRVWLTLLLFPLLLVLLLFGALADPASLGAAAAGALVGVALALWGLRLTRFEATPQALFYTPNAHIGIALSLLFVGRVAYRALQLYGLGPPTGGRPEDFARSPLTLLIFATLAGYYCVYAAGLLRWKSRVESAPVPAADAPR